MISTMADLVCELPHELLKNVRFTILGNKEILGIFQILVETEPSAQSSFQKTNFSNSSQKTSKSRYQIFLVLSSFTGFLYFVLNTLSRILSENKFWVLDLPSLLHTLIFCYFAYYQSISPFFKENLKQECCVKLPNLIVLCKHCFSYLV